MKHFEREWRRLALHCRSKEKEILMSHSLKFCFLLVVVAGAIGSLAGCTEKATDELKVQIEAELPATLFLDSAPADAKSLTDVKQSAKVGDTITFKARIGGKVQPFSSGHAIVMVVDGKMEPCSDECLAPWDYCCDTKEDITANAASVQVVDSKGNPIPISLEKKSGLEAGGWINVTGTVLEKNDAGLFSVGATGVFVGQG